jgi:hypothetical protein
MRRRLPLTGLMTALLLSCGGAPESLPPVRSPDTGCRPEDDGKVVVGVVNAGDNLSGCIDDALAQGCRGVLKFDVEVDEVGQARLVELRGQASPSLRACLQVSIEQAALGPATDCQGHFVRAQANGGFAWDAGELEYSWRLANLAGASTAWRESCPVAPPPRTTGRRESNGTGRPNKRMQLTKPAQSDGASQLIRSVRRTFRGATNRARSEGSDRAAGRRVAAT